MTTIAEWCLGEDQRQETIKRTKWNITAVAFFKGISVTEEAAEQMAASAEKKAYTVAKVESCTTTGVRPAMESLQAYTRKLSNLVIEALKHIQAGDTARKGEVRATSATESLDLTGDREFLTREGAEEALAPLLDPGAKHTKLRFSTKSFGKESAEVAARALHNIRATLQEAHMSDIIAGRPEDEALGALRTMSAALKGARLRLLNLSDNALGEKGVRACADAFTHQPALESVSFQNVGCSVKACQALDELLPRTGHLRCIHLYNNMSGDEGAEAIAKVLARSPDIADFKMASSRVGPEGGIALAGALRKGYALERLDLSDNPLTSEVAGPLAAALPPHQALRVLNLSDTGLEDEGVAILAAALATAAPLLEELHLALNEMSAQSAKAVALALQNKSVLRVLNLRENELGDKGACLIAVALKPLSKLAILDLTTNQIRRAGGLAVARAAVEKPGLEQLALDDNEIPEDAVEQIKEIFEEAGKAGALGSLEDMAEPDEEEEEEQEEDEAGAEADLTAAMQKLLVN